MFNIKEYANEADKILQDKPRNTGSNLAREICELEI